MTNRSNFYYKKLLEFLSTLASILRKELKGVVYESFLREPDQLNLRCYEVMCVLNHDKPRVPDRVTMQRKIPGLADLCQKCMPFFLKRRSNLSKADDITTGVKFQEPFIRFFQSIGIKAFDASEEDIRLPDIGIRNRRGEVTSLLEIKYHNAPFIKARQYVSSDTECYDGSLTIDVEKCSSQNELAKDIYPNSENLIVHWVDFPCIKCVLWDSLDSATGTAVYERMHRSGDYEFGRKVGYTKKIYHYISKLNDFDSLVKKASTW